LISDPVVEAALESLTCRINLANSVLVARDEEHVKEYLRILKVNGHSLNAEKIKSWAVRNDWPIKAADKLKKLADKMEKQKSKPNLRGLRMRKANI
jgi:hypothetical protein